MTPSRRRPLDQVLVERGHAGDLRAARDLVASGRVLVDGAPTWSTSRAVAADEQVELVRIRTYVGRGGEKLVAALDRFEVVVADRLALDVGASTGGFTDCLLQRGAARVLAVDVGHDQLHERLAGDARVVAMERTNVRDLTADGVLDALGGAPSVLVVDVSFTSIIPHLPAIVALGEHEATLLVLVKPQFEVPHDAASRGRGVITDPTAWRAVLERCASAIEEAGAGIIGAMASPILGASGNAEFFVAATLGRPGAVALPPLVAQAVSEAPHR
jgi:23S rRNA (cytidine1920-2'-O)/16S rRNA (cytidine1409-2'-O)-methyltransferase